MMILSIARLFHVCLLSLSVNCLWSESMMDYSNHRLANGQRGSCINIVVSFDSAAAADVFLAIDIKSLCRLLECVTSPTYTHTLIGRSVCVFGPVFERVDRPNGKIDLRERD